MAILKAKLEHLRIHEPQSSIEIFVKLFFEFARRYIRILGVVLAVQVSWSHNESILWAIPQGLLSWMYLAWYIIFQSWKHI